MYPTTAAASAPVPKPTMASRRRSVMPPPAAAAAPKIAKAPVAKVKLVCGLIFWMDVLYVLKRQMLRLKMKQVKKVYNDQPLGMTA